jgi:sporulation protein YabP
MPERMKTLTGTYSVQRFFKEGFAMAYEDSKKTVQKPHSLIMEERRKLSLTGVEDVESFDDAEIVMRTVCGDLIVKGSDLQIDRLSLDTGEVSIIGMVTDLNYEESAPSGSLWTKLFH